ncbi:uncharacterized protein LOC136032949 [Artemia franciscana]|uniref:uncharacterized protein LOC136032949 n=1 Tax=Artemia franciscana TaxID=6661 RepID=UPI0032DA2716
MSLIQKSLDSKTVPLDCKSSDITPIFKNGYKINAENYQLISSTSAVAKTLEPIVNAKILAHLQSNSILSLDQHGLLLGKSVEINLLETYNIINNLLEKGVPVDLILLDLAKAFDKVPHSRLRAKLSAVGIHTDVVKWVKNFLTDQKQQVQLFTNNCDKVTSSFK